MQDSGNLEACGMTFAWYKKTRFFSRLRLPNQYNILQLKKNLSEQAPINKYYIQISVKFLRMGKNTYIPNVQ